MSNQSDIEPTQGIDCASDSSRVCVEIVEVSTLAAHHPLPQFVRNRGQRIEISGDQKEAVAPIRKLLTEYEEITAGLGDMEGDAMDKAMARMAKLQDEIDHLDAWELDRQLDQAAQALCLPPYDADVAVLSGGEKRRIALCKTLISHPDLLLLDEPTNHLDANTVSWLETHLDNYKGTIILITHDRYFQVLPNA